MIYGFLFLAVLLMCLMLGGIRFLQTKKMKEKIPLQVMFGVASLSIILCFLGMFVPSEKLSLLFFGLYFLCSDLHIISLIFMSECYNAVYHKTAVFKSVLWGLFGIDAFVMLGNVFSKCTLTVECLAVNDSLTYRYFKPVFPMMWVHMLYFYFLGIVLLSALLLKVKKTVKLYRRKYLFLTVCIAVVSVLSIMIGLLKMSMDFSCILFALLSVVIAYFIMVVIPREEADDIVKYSLDGISNGIICFNKENVCVYVNEVAKKMFHLMGNEASIEDTFATWLASRDPENIPQQTFYEEKKVKGENLHYDTTYNPLIGEFNTYFGCVFSMHNRTDEVKALEAEREKAEMDSLTGVYNRESFFKKVKETINADRSIKWLLVCMDIKDFKTYNALFGEKQGDEVLIKAARILKESNKENYIVGRLVSDRFVVCIPQEDFDEEYLKNSLIRICSCVKSDVFRLHIHAGIYRIHDYAMEISVMCDHAYLAVRKIKDDYGEMVAWYDSNVGAEHRNSKLMIGEFDRALMEGQFQIFLQPQLTGEGRILGAEALVRWIHPTKGLIPPVEFISVFERAGLIHKLDQYVWRQACGKLAAWKNEGKEEFYISVNISPVDFYYVNVYEYFTKLVEEYRIDPQNLKLEITESAIVNDAADNLRVINKLTQYGFEVEIDDFGSGYSSLNTLKDIDFDAIKLDRIFLQETAHKEKSRIIMNNTIVMSKQLGIKVISEGVETKEQLDYLVDAGCDVFQGYYFEKPISVRAFEDKYLLQND